MATIFRDNDPDLEDYDAYREDPPEKAQSNPTKTDEGTVATQGAAETTASCDSKELYTKVGTPILSITFLLSEEHPFEVNVGAGMTTNYKRSEKKAFPVLCEIKDFASGSEVKIESLKNKGCIAKNLPKVLAPYLTELNRLLLDQYNVYYDSTKYDEFVTAQGAFLEAQRQKPSKKVEEEKGEEEEEKQQQEPQLTPEQQERKRKLEENVLKKLKDRAVKRINVDDPDVKVRIEEISKQNGIGEYFTEFLADQLALDEGKTEDKKKYSEMFPLYLLEEKYDGNDGQQLILTNNGIITNGILIFSYLNVDIKNGKILANTLGFMWTLKNEYQKALNVLNGEKTDEDFISDKLINDGFPEEGFPKKGGIGNRKTFSKKLFKKRATRRIRK